MDGNALLDHSADLQANIPRFYSGHNPENRIKAMKEDGKDHVLHVLVLLRGATSEYPEADQQVGWLSPASDCGHWNFPPPSSSIPVAALPPPCTISSRLWPRTRAQAWTWTWACHTLARSARSLPPPPRCTSSSELACSTSKHKAEQRPLTSLTSCLGPRNQRRPCSYVVLAGIDW